MRILVYGAGNIGSLYAALLMHSGQDVSILARGKRLADIRENGIQLEDIKSEKKNTTRVTAIERLDAEDPYDLVLVILPKNHVSEVLPILAENRQTPSVMFFGHNAAGPQEMIDMLGRERVLHGFPGSAAVPNGDVIQYLICSRREQPTTIGELDGSRSPRIKAIRDALSLAGFPVTISANMDAWLKTHVAEIVPTATALYKAGGDIRRLEGCRETLLLMLRAIREGHRVITALDIPITPRSHKVFGWIPEQLLLVLMKLKFKGETGSIKLGHALRARAEMNVIGDEFRELIEQANVQTPSLDILYRNLEIDTPNVIDADVQGRNFERLAIQQEANGNECG